MDEVINRATPPNIWGGGGFEVHEVEDAEERPDPRLPWLVMVNGVGSWPVAWFYEEGDARLWSDTMNAHFPEELKLRARIKDQSHGG